MTATHRLAAILSADIVGYSRLMRQGRAWDGATSRSRLKSGMIASGCRSASSSIPSECRHLHGSGSPLCDDRDAKATITWVGLTQPPFWQGEKARMGSLEARIYALADIPKADRERNPIVREASWAARKNAVADRRGQL
jgi:hypothetical protein